MRTLTLKQQKAAAKEFADKWLEIKPKEIESDQKFWEELLEKVFGLERPYEYLQFQHTVKLGGKKTGRPDILVGKDVVRVLVEQKSYNVDLKAEERGGRLTPYEQAKSYWNNYGGSQKPRWIVTCNFHEFHIYDMDSASDPEPTIVYLKNFEREYKYLSFLVDPKNDNIRKEHELSVEAGKIVAKLYETLLHLYVDDEKRTMLANRLIVRLVFCLYSEDAGLFHSNDAFYRYLKDVAPDRFRSAIKELFRILNTKEEDRDPNEDPKLSQFPYVDGGLFKNAEEGIPNFDKKAVDILLNECSRGFCWSDINPTIFGAVFESTLNTETQKKGGMYYTSIENIHKVIDPLFLDGFKARFQRARALKKHSERKKALEALREDMASHVFLDPACGSGNFLTETYLCLRKIENDILRILEPYQIKMMLDNPVKIDISNFYGIEINDFACAVARTALWIADSQMKKETLDIVSTENLDFFPLTTSAHILEADALKTDWSEFVPFTKGKAYIVGNPPFIGASNMEPDQRNTVAKLFHEKSYSHSLDYVCGWYKKASEMIKIHYCEAAFVSTNSITQGEQVYPLWSELFGDEIKINFAHRTFKWENGIKGSNSAAVYCVVIGIGPMDRNDKKLFIYKTPTSAPEIKCVDYLSPYLCELSADTAKVLVQSRGKSLFSPLKTTMGNKPADDGNFILSEEQKNAIEGETPAIKPYIRRYVGAKDFLHASKQETRYCLWLKDAPVGLIESNKEVKRRIRNIRQFRLDSEAEPTQKKAEFPMEFFSNPQRERDFIAIPRVSSENRKYIPMAFEKSDVIAADSLSIIANGDLFIFGLLNSSVHMVWVRAIAGRLKGDYRYSGHLVFNNFPIPMDVTEEQKEKIKETAEKILRARKAEMAKQKVDLASLYDVDLMPKNLKLAHKANDKAVLRLYGLDLRSSDAKIFETLLRAYKSRLEEIQQGRKEKSKKPTI